MRRSMSFVLVLVACPAVVAAQQPKTGDAAKQQRTVDLILEEADQAREAGESEKVLSLLREAYAIKAVPELMNNIGRTLEDLGRYGEAIEAYKRVADNPSVDPGLRALDAARMAALQSKLGRAWVLPKLVPENASLLADGKLPAAPAGKEFPVDPGPHLFQMTIPLTGETVLRVKEFPVDRRTVFSEDLRTASPGEGRIALRGGPVAFVEIVIDGREVAGDVSKLDAIRLPAGRYRVQAKTSDGSQLVLDVKVEAGKFPKLTSFIPPPPVTKTEETVAAKGPRARDAGIWPWVTVGAGAAVAGLGAGLIVWAEKDRGKLKDMGTDSRGVVTGLTYAEARSIESGANRKAVAGAVLTGVGVAAIAGGVTWWFLSRSPGGDKAKVSFAATPDAIVITGRF